MNNIGYAIFKKTSNLVVDSNGMFEELQLANNVNSIIDNLNQLKGVEEKVLCFKRISSKLGTVGLKDAYLVVLLERVNKNNESFLLGSAICFKEFQINENKIIDGVKYLLSQLQRNFESNFDVEDENLGVILPSTNKDFKIFKNQKLSPNNLKPSIIAFDEVSISNKGVNTCLNQFCNNTSFGKIECLLLTPSTVLLKEFGYEKYQRINIQTILNPRTSIQKKEVLSSSTAENLNFRNELIKVTSEKNKIQKDRNLFRILTFCFFIGALVFALLFITKNGGETKKVVNSSLFPINDVVYISHSNYNVNVRSTPVYDSNINNLKTTLSDGDKVVLLGFDKKTLWAKISYNSGSETGYVSNRLISKNIDTDRVRVINKKAYINGASYSYIPLYSSPKEIGKSTPNVLIYLKSNDEIFIKNKDLKLNTYSVKVEGNNEIYHGYLESQNIKYY